MSGPIGPCTAGPRRWSDRPKRRRQTLRQNVVMPRRLHHELMRGLVRVISQRQAEDPLEDAASQRNGAGLEKPPPKDRAPAGACSDDVVSRHLEKEFSDE